MKYQISTKYLTEKYTYPRLHLFCQFWVLKHFQRKSLLSEIYFQNRHYLQSRLRTIVIPDDTRTGDIVKEISELTRLCLIAHYFNREVALLSEYQPKQDKYQIECQLDIIQMSYLERNRKKLIRVRMKVFCVLSILADFLSAIDSYLK